MARVGAGARLTLLLLVCAWLLTSCRAGQEGLVASGSFEAERITVCSEVTGRMLEWHAQEGQSVRLGEALGLIDTTQLYLQRMALLAGQPRARVKRLPSTVDTVSLLLRYARLDSARVRLMERPLADGLDRWLLQDVEGQMERVKRTVQAARAGGAMRIDSTSSMLDIQLAQIDLARGKSWVVSPLEGVVVQNFIHEGELAVAGHPLCQVADLSRLSLRAYLPFHTLSHLRLGDTVRVLTDRGEGASRSYSGIVRWISEQAEFTPKSIQLQDERENLVYAVRVEVVNDGYLKIGMYGEMHFPRLPD